VTSDRALILETPRRRWLATPAIWSQPSSAHDVVAAKRPLIAAEFPYDASFDERALSQLPPIDAMMDLLKAADRIAASLERGEHVVVCGDYDVDGTTACALLHRFFEHYNLPVTIHIPNRLTEGYGLSRTAIEALFDSGARVVVTVDNGIAALDACQRAQELGIDVIITDHHEPQQQLPPAFAIVNPKQPGCPFPYKHLSGVGVAFYLCMALRRRLGQRPGVRPLVLRQLLDLVAIGTIADVCPLHGLNHVLTRLGLDVLREHLGAHSQEGEGPRPGLAALAKVCGLQDDGLATLSAETVAFQIGPRLNAAGRLGTALATYRLLATSDGSEAQQLAAQLDEENASRRALEREASALIASSYATGDNTDEPPPALVLCNKAWHPGILGIIASRCVDRFHKPAIVLTEWDGVLKGSGRSTEDLDLFAVLAPLSQQCLAFGGHARAVGMTLAIDQFESFKALFLSSLSAHLAARVDPVPNVPSLGIDAVVSPDDLDLQFVRTLSGLEPFGAGNTRPMLVIKGAQVEALQPIGRNHEDGHCTLTVVGSQTASHGRTQAPLRITAFGMRKALEDTLTHSKSLHLAITASEGSWRGRSKLELRLVDFASTKPHKTD
jgi:single-stranded-DNA-specific exonuclease